MLVSDLEIYDDIIQESEERPWGNFIKFIDNKPCTVKLLEMKNGGSTSLQFHKHRSEYIYVIAGRISITIVKNNTKVDHMLSPGDSFIIASNTIHRYSAVKDSLCLEIALGDFDENDIVRLDDEYGRCDKCQ